MKKELLKKKIIPAINYHVWKTCNMNCKFCFGQFKSTNESNENCTHLNKEESIKLIDMIIDFGFEKITFSGGEPTLCPWLHKLIKKTKQAGLITCIVTNGSMIDEKWLKNNHRYIDWIALSIDSINPKTNLISGRYQDKSDLQDYIEKINLIKKYHIKLKINTVVSKYNYMEDLTSLIKNANPSRWKLFQALPLKIENDNYSNEFTISSNQFNEYVNRNKKAIPESCIVPESNSQMTCSYLMIAPNGHLFDNNNGKLNYSNSILKVGFNEALRECNYSCEKFIQRGGLYKW